MNDMRFLPDDPRLTAYALGELTGDERAMVEAALRENPALRMAVDEIRATAIQLESALAGESIVQPARPVTASRGLVIDLNGRSAEAGGFKSAGRHQPPSGRKQRAGVNGSTYEVADSRPGILRFPQFYYVVATAAAACFAVFVAMRQPSPRSSPSMAAPPVARQEITLSPAATDVASSETVAPAPAIPVEADTPLVAAVLPATPATSAVDDVTAAVAELSAPPVAPALVGGDLTLIGQATRDRERVGQDGIVPFTSAAPVSRDPGVLRPRVLQERAFPSTVTLVDAERATATPLENASVEKSYSGILTTHPTRATTVSTRTPGPVRFEAVAPPVSQPIVASPTVPSLVPNPSVVASSGGTVTTTATGEVVVLSAFMVNGDRAVGFAGVQGARNNAIDQRKTARRDDLPSPPPGAKFGRNTEAYSYVRDNDFLSAALNPLSTLAVDVDTASYANVRRILEQGSPPPRDAVRIEELVNYFPYRYPAPRGDQPFAAALEVADAPWAPNHRLVRIGLKAREVPAARRPAASLVLLLDVSGSMNQPNKLPLVQQSLRLLLGKLRADDRVAIVTYAGDSGLVLPSTPVAQSREILNAIDTLTPGGAANGAMGIHLAYEIAKANFVPEGINRVILCTDGDFNVGATSEGELVRLIEEKAASGVFLTVLGFGMGNYKDATLEKLADKGNGNYGYIDTRREAEKVLVEQVNSTLVTVAKDVKVQVEFNPATVASFRLIGYENRLLRKEEFNDDNVDAGEVGSGHTVTVLYEIVPVGAAKPGETLPPVDELRYAARGAVSSRLEMPSGKRDPLSNELLTVKVRYKKSDSLFSFPKTLEFPLVNATTTFAKASADFRFAAAVAQFGMILRGSPHRGTGTMRDVAAWAASAAATPASDPGGYRGEFLELVRRAQTMVE